MSKNENYHNHSAEYPARTMLRNKKLIQVIFYADQHQKDIPTSF
jgi:hypothetical protein